MSGGSSEDGSDEEKIEMGVGGYGAMGGYMVSESPGA